MKKRLKCPNCKKRMKVEVHVDMKTGKGTWQRVCLKCGYPDKAKMALREKRKRPIRTTLIQRVAKKDKPVIKKVEG